MISLWLRQLSGEDTKRLSLRDGVRGVAAAVTALCTCHCPRHISYHCSCCVGLVPLHMTVLSPKAACDKHTAQFGTLVRAISTESNHTQERAVQWIGPQVVFPNLCMSFVQKVCLEFIMYFSFFFINI